MSELIVMHPMFFVALLGFCVLTPPIVLAIVLWKRVMRPTTAQCCGCGVQHSRRNQCDDSLSAFCTDACYTRTMEGIDEGALIGEVPLIHKFAGSEPDAQGTILCRRCGLDESAHYDMEEED